MFFYRIEFFDEVNKEITKGTGLVAAQGWSEACTQIVEYYGEKNIINIESLYECDPIIELKELKCMFKEN